MGKDAGAVYQHWWLLLTLLAVLCLQQLQEHFLLQVLQLQVLQLLLPRQQWLFRRLQHPVRLPGH